MNVVKPWDVFHVQQGNGYKPKFFIALLQVRRFEYGVNVTLWHGFYINTSPQYVGGLKGNDIAISSVVYQFLKHNSSINAGEINTHYESQLVEYRDYIRQGDRAKVFAVVERSKTLEAEHVQALLALKFQPTAAL